MNRALALTLLAVVLAACGGGKPASSQMAQQAASQPAQTSAPSMKDRLDALEQQGVLPALDRSTDMAGPDANRNGIRDDIDAYIAALPVNDLVKKAARQRARVQQRIAIVDLHDRVALMALADASMAATACMSESAEMGLPLEQQSQAGKDGFSITLKLQAITANTPERAERYLAYMGALHGTTTTYPTGKVCDEE
jgi:hypothetical protein